MAARRAVPRVIEGIEGIEYDDRAQRRSGGVDPGRHRRRRRAGRLRSRLAAGACAASRSRSSSRSRRDVARAHDAAARRAGVLELAALRRRRSAGGAAQGRAAARGLAHHRAARTRRGCRRARRSPSIGTRSRAAITRRAGARSERPHRAPPARRAAPGGPADHPRRRSAGRRRRRRARCARCAAIASTSTTRSRRSSTADSIDWDHAFRGSRCGQAAATPRATTSTARSPTTSTARSSRRCAPARRSLPHAFEEPRYFEGCLPIEVMAERGDDVLAFGPMKPVGPRTPTRYAVVQLRAENRYATSYNLVGFQTRLTYPEQKRIFAMIPALAQRRVPALRIDPPQLVHRVVAPARRELELQVAPECAARRPDHRRRGLHRVDGDGAARRRCSARPPDGPAGRAAAARPPRSARSISTSCARASRASRSSRPTSTSACCRRSTDAPRNASVARSTRSAPSRRGRPGKAPISA